MDQLLALRWTLIGGGIYFLICGGFGAYVASQKGRGGLEGLLFGFFLGPIGIAWEYLMPHRGITERVKRKRQEKREMARHVIENL
jgi:hypothetical protein